METLLPILFNFACLVLILWYAGRKPVTQMLQTRSLSVETAIAEADKMALEAGAILNRWESSWKACEAHAKKLMEDGKETMHRLRETTLQRSRLEAERIHKDGKLMGQSEILKTKRVLQEDLAHRSVFLATRYLTDHIPDEDKHRLVTDYVESVVVGSGV